MKKAFRHASAVVQKPAKKNVVKAPRRRSAQTATPKLEKARHLTAPIFNTSMVGKLIKYERPFDSVWPEMED